jgi:hypothetical protein
MGELMKVLILAILGFLCSLFLPGYPIYILMLLFCFYILLGAYCLYVGFFQCGKLRKPKDAVFLMLAFIVTLHCFIITGSILNRKLHEDRAGYSNSSTDKVGNASMQKD